VYNRPEHTRKTLETLEKNDLAHESELFIYADGPKDGLSEEGRDRIRRTRDVLREKQWCGAVHIIEQTLNKGLARSVIDGVTDVVDRFGKVIVLEDDLHLSRNFLSYMNDALNRFEDDQRVMQISGYLPPVALEIDTDAFFLPYINSWGWGTWKRVWNDFDESAGGIRILEKDKSLRYAFDLEGSYPYYKMLRSQVGKNIDSWAIRFYLSVFLKKGLALYPRKSLVRNIGMDGTGVHCKIDIDQEDIDDDFSVNTFDSVRVLPQVKQKVYGMMKQRMIIMNRVWRFFRQYVLKK
jgi:hypothetical protein